MYHQKLEDEIDLSDLGLTILGEWRVVASACVGSVLLAAVYAFAIAPTRYDAAASLRGIVQAFCPASVECAVPLEDTMAAAAALVSSNEGFASLDAALDLSGDTYFSEDGDLQSEEIRRNFFDAVNVAADGVAVAISVSHSDDRRAVDIANTIAQFIAAQLEARASENFAQQENSLRLRLAALTAPSATTIQVETLVQLERAAIEAQLASLAQRRDNMQFVAAIDRPAALPLEMAAPRRSLFLALGVILGIFLGIGAAIVASMRRGTLHSVAAVTAALNGRDAIVGQGNHIGADKGHTLWQDIRVSFGEFENGAIVVTGFASDEVIIGLARGLASEFARSGVPVGVIDLGARNMAVSEGFENLDATLLLESGSETPFHACSPSQMVDILARLDNEKGVLIILPPPPARDLATVRKAIALSKGRVFLAKRGEITRNDAQRLLLAERDVGGRRVLAII